MAVRFGDYEFDAGQRRLSRRGAAIHVTPLAFTLLEILVTEAPRVFTKEELHRRLWPESFVSDASLSSLIKELRRALGDRESRALIRTVNRVGYGFGGAIVASAPAPVPAAGAMHWVEVHGRRQRLHAGENVIGRAPDAEVWLDVASVSRRHAAIVVDGSVAHLRDLGSKNGTRAHDRPVERPVRLDDGDEVSVGTIKLVYHRASGGLPTETQG